MQSLDYTPKKKNTLLSNDASHVLNQVTGTTILAIKLLANFDFIGIGISFPRKVEIFTSSLHSDVHTSIGRVWYAVTTKCYSGAASIFIPR